jgi:hypothetical protein
MKISRKFKRNEAGLASLMFLILLVIMALLATAGGAALIRMHREVEHLAQQQVKRLNSVQTNSITEKVSGTPLRFASPTVSSRPSGFLPLPGVGASLQRASFSENSKSDTTQE